MAPQRPVWIFVKLELGAGHRPTRGYEHHDAFAFDHIEHVSPPWELDFPDGTVDEVLALAFIEHLTYDQARDTFRTMHAALIPDGQFLFDVPNYPIWAGYYCRQIDAPSGEYTSIPSLDWCRRTLFGWQRWPGDEHKSGWDQALIRRELSDVGYRTVQFDVAPFKQRAYRRRFDNPADAHLYVIATK